MADAPQRLLDPIHPPIRLRSEYVRKEPTVLVMRQKLFTVKDEDFLVADMPGRGWLRVARKGLSARDKKTISSLDHVPLYAMQTKRLSWGYKTIIQDAQGEELFMIKEKASWKSKLHCNVPTPTGEEHLTLFGRAFKHSAEIKADDGRVLATISRECFGSDAREGVFKNKETYYITVAAGVDLCLMVMLCLAFDDLKDVEAARSSHG